jgi:creatinine amidohydrolase
MQVMKPLLWAELTWEQIRDMQREGVDMVLFPVGSTEQHGPHLPLNVDTLCAEVVAHAVSSRTSVPVLPTLPFGCALGHTRHWPGTLSLSPSTLALVIREVLDDVVAYGFKRVLVMSGHVTNAAPLRCALEELRKSHPRLQIAQRHLCEVSPAVQRAYESDAQDWHANAAETALMLHLAPKLVHTDRIFDDEDRTGNCVFSYTVPQTSKAGHTGTPSKATAQMGAELFEALVTDWTYLVKRALIEKPPLEQSTNKQPPICGPPPKTPAASTRTEATCAAPSNTTSGADLFRAPTSTLKDS